MSPAECRSGSLLITRTKITSKPPSSCNLTDWPPLIAEQMAKDGEAEDKLGRASQSSMQGSELSKRSPRQQAVRRSQCVRRGGCLNRCKSVSEECVACEGCQEECRIHTKAVPLQACYKCSSCDQTFSQKISLNVHLMFKHGAPRRYQCDKCDYEGPRLYHLKRHMKVHSDERQFVCQDCGKGLKTIQAYRNHRVLHTNVGRFTCHICNKAFNQKSLYEDHVRSHQVERNFECTYCDATFKTYKHVACHIRAVHLNDKRFICDVCGAQHMTGANLKTHMKKHKDLSSLPYAYHCTSCEAAFRGAEGLAVHVRVMHKVILSSDSDMPEVSLSTLHPTRRPVKIQYGLSSSNNDPDDPEEISLEADESTVLVEGENLTVVKAKTSDIIYEI